MSYLHRTLYVYYKGVNQYNLTKFVVQRKQNFITFKQKREVRKYTDSKLQQYTLKLNNVEKPSKIQAGKNKFQEVGALAETRDNPNTFFFDANAKVLYVSIPTDEQNEIHIR